MPSRRPLTDRWIRRIAALCLLPWLAGCAQPPQVGGGAARDEDAWSGRLALQFEVQPGQPPQSFSAAFDLHGDAQSGGLALLNPLGNRLAQLDWKDGQARLQSAQETRSSQSLDALLQELTGTRVPVAALFSWLKGVEAEAEGWRADLSALRQGRIVARREPPFAPAVLRIALSR